MTDCRILFFEQYMGQRLLVGTGYSALQYLKRLPLQRRQMFEF